MPFKRTFSLLALLLVFCASAAFRLWDLGSDPYPRLDWSSGLLTDEGFYTHNARSAVLYGIQETDDFNNRLISPLLHFLHIAVFRAFGTGSVPARSVSVVCGFATIIVLWFALRAAFGSRVALFGALFLGLEHASFLYNRMALLDTPAAFLATVAFALFVIAHRRKGAWPCVALFASGLVLSGALITRSLAVFFLAGPVAAFGVARSSRARVVAWLSGLLLGIGLYAVLWYLPNRAEISRMSAYYLGHQLAPPSLLDFLGNLGRGFFGDHRGIAPYLVRHIGVCFALSLAALAALRPRFRSDGRDTAAGTSAGEVRQVAEAYLWAWAAGALAFFVVVNYAPSRYYVTAFPALSGLAAIALDQLPRIVAVFTTNWRLRAAFAAFFAFHLVESILHRGGLLSAEATWAVLLGTALCAAVVAWRWRGEASSGKLRRARVVLGACWVVGNGYWIADWLRTLNHSQQRASRWLADALPPGSVILGDVAPGLCMENRHLPVNVIPGLCNGDRPVERFAGRPRFIAILDGRWKEKYWLENYSDLVREGRALARLGVMRWDIGIYPVPPEAQSRE